MPYARRRSFTDPFTDMLFNALMGFTFLFLVAILFINPIPKSGIVDPKAEYIITIQWPDFDPNDIDIWVQNPRGDIVWFRNPEVGLLHLDRDDRGNFKDSITVEGKEIVNPLNQEVVTLRGVVPGEYIVNVHYYESKTADPIDVHVMLEKINPKLETLYYGTVKLSRPGEEKTAFRFRIGQDSTVRDIHTLPKRMSLIEPSGES